MVWADLRFFERTRRSISVDDSSSTRWLSPPTRALSRQSNSQRCEVSGVTLCFHSTDGNHSSIAY